MDRLELTIALVILGVLGIATIRRNAVWHDPLTLWQDAATKSPDKLRPLINLATEQDRRGDKAGAIATLSHAVALPARTEVDRQSIGMAKTNMALLYIQSGQFQDAYNLLVPVLKETPNLEAINAMALVAIAGGNPRAALDLTAQMLNLNRAVLVRPSWHATRGQALQAMGRCVEAAIEYRALQNLMPDFVPPACP